MSDQTIFPAYPYRDARAAIDWLGRAFGFEPRMVVDGPNGTVAHAELVLGDAMIMLGSARDGDGYAPPPRGGAGHAPAPGGAALYVVLADPDAPLERARAAGADVVRELTDTDYGSREYSVRGSEGNHWSFGTYQPWAS